MSAYEIAFWSVMPIVGFVLGHIVGVMHVRWRYKHRVELDEIERDRERKDP